MEPVKGSDPMFKFPRISTGIMKLDKLIGGGYPRPKTTIIFGTYSSGKTWLCQKCIAQGQKDGLTALYVDCERAYDEEWWRYIGVDTDKLMVAWPDSGEEAINTIIEALRSGVDIVVLDSLAALVSEQESEEGMEWNPVGLQARLISKAMRKITAANKKSVFLAINQIRAAIGMGAGDALPGGLAQTFHASLILKLIRAGWITEEKERIGYKLRISAFKSRVSAPFIWTELEYLFKSQYDEVVGNVSLAVETGVIIKRGPYYSFGEFKTLGKQEMAVRMKDDSKLYESLVRRLAGATVPNSLPSAGESSEVDA